MTRLEPLVDALIAAMLVELLLRMLEGYLKNKNGR
jgi:hypothetical protein